jgi:hypothetical protein
VLGPDVLVVEPLGLLVGQRHDLACPVGEALEHVRAIMNTAIVAGAITSGNQGPVVCHSIDRVAVDVNAAIQGEMIGLCFVIYSALC